MATRTAVRLSSGGMGDATPMASADYWRFVFCAHLPPIVFGQYPDAPLVASEYGLADSEIDLGAWLTEKENEAWQEAGGSPPTSWAEMHDRAVDELDAAIRPPR